MSQLLIYSDCPLSRLSDFLNAFLLKHFYEVFLNSALNHFSVLSRLSVGDLRLDRFLFDVLREELFPLAGDCKVEFHQNGIVRTLGVHPHVCVVDNEVDLCEWANRIRDSWLKETFLST